MRRALLAGLVLVAACGDDDDYTPVAPAPTPAAPQAGINATSGGGWVTVTDPDTGRTFRCLSGWDNHGYGEAGGPFLWCYIAGGD